ncbi:MAG: type II secretion system protein GspN [Myxococcota bacterium]
MKALKITGITLGYLVFFVVCTAIFVRMLFPTQQAKEFVALRLAEATGAETVTIDDLGLTGLGMLGVVPSGVEVKGVQMTLPGVKKKTTQQGGSVITDKRKVTIDRLAAKAGLSGILANAPDVSFEVDVGGGHIRGGHYVREKDAHVIKIDSIEGVKLGPELLFQSLTGLDIQGKLSGKIDMTIPVVDRDGKSVAAIDQMVGKIELSLADGVVLAPVIDLGSQGRDQLTDIDLGQVRLAFTAEGATTPGGIGAGATTGADPKAAARVPRKGDATVINIDEVTVEGGDVSVAAAPRGTIAFVTGASPKEATMNIHLAVKLEDQFFDKAVPDEKAPGGSAKPNAKFRTLMSVNPLKNNVQDGQFGVAITGLLGDPKVRTERPRTKVGGGGAASRKMNIDQPGGDEGGEGDEEKPKAKVREPLKPNPPTEGEGTMRKPGTAMVRNPPAMARPVQATPVTPPRPRPVLPTSPGPGESLPGAEPTAAPPTLPPPAPETAPPPDGAPPDPGVDPNAPPPEELPQPQ